jgi:hypothetical protein
MLFCPDKYKIVRPQVNKELMALEGELTDSEAKAALGRFLRANIGLGLQILTKHKFRLALYQEILLKAIFNRNFSMIVASRGGSKSFIAALVSFLYPLFNPGTNVVICGPTFRTARHIFNNLEKIIDSKEGILLRQCFGAKTKRNDAFEYELNGGIIRAIPMNSEKLRGFRAQLLILDEFLLFSEEVIKKVLMPFLIVPDNIGEKIGQSEKEDDLIKSGAMKEDERMVFPSSARMLCLTSASYTFENAYKVYKEWTENILAPEKKEDTATYFVAQIGWKALPKYFIEKSVIEEANAAGEDDPIAKREYGAQFVDGSDSYFSALRMLQQTVKDTEEPTTKVYGDDSKEYILSIDPSWSQASNSDDFAMSVLEINQDQSVTLVHSYAMHGGELNEHIRYLLYLILSFNIILIIADNADGNFIQSANESEIFREKNIKLGFIDYEGELQGEEYAKMLREIRKQYNLNEKRICIKHIFNSNSIRRINEQLQTFINTKRIWFASKLEANGSLYKEIIKRKLPYEFGKNQQIGENICNLISTQDHLIGLTKKECALIEVSSNPTGGQKFDLPALLKRNTSADRARKDNYTSLMLGVEGYKAYTDIMRQDIAPKAQLFIPQMVGNSTFR